MGNYQCCFRPPSPKPQRRECSNPGYHVNATPDKSFVQQQCSNGDEQSRLQPPEKTIAMVRNSVCTLGERLLNSPARSPPCITEGDLSIIKQRPNRMYLSSPEIGSEFFSPRTSFCSPGNSLCFKGLEKVDERDEEEFAFSSMSRGQSGHLPRKVKFRLPEEGDIVVLYPSGQPFEEDDRENHKRSPKLTTENHAFEEKTREY
ncbi:hypothetical protein NMG60_11009923 [Bertholletia excelsa]